MPNQQRPVLKARLEQLISLVGGLMARYPRTIALFGFCSGVFSFIMVDRQKGFAQVLAIIMLVSWVWLILENLLRETFARRFGWEIPAPLLRYATQLIHQESLFFVLPFFLITTTWNSGQALFTGTLAAAALISITDPLYYRWLSRRRWVFLAYHTLTLFAVLLTSLPILLHLTTPESYRLSLGIAVVLSFPSLLVTFPLQHWWRGFLLLGLTLAVGLAGWFGRTWVPPATLWLTEVAVSSQFDDQSRTPGDSLEQVAPPSCAARACSPIPRSTRRAASTSASITCGCSTGRSSTASPWISTAAARRATGPGPTSRTSPATRSATGR